VADITYVAVAVGFVYVAVIMDAWSRRIIGYAISRRIDARLTLAALGAAIALRQPPPGCVHHGDRGSQYAAENYRDRLREAKLLGSMGRRGNPYDNAMMESLMIPEGRRRLPARVRDPRGRRGTAPRLHREVQRQAPPLIAWLPQP
jgi:putative transposase